MRSFITSLALVAAAGATSAHASVLHSEHAPGDDSGSYIASHFRNEHHIESFDLASFFALHDLNRDGVLDVSVPEAVLLQKGQCVPSNSYPSSLRHQRSEIEAIYGVHHSLSVKHSPTHEVHDAKADHIVSTVLKRLDKNLDGQITKQEFINGGEEGLPKFPEFGKNALGHHYDEESEFFMHHEEVYHNTPEKQQPAAYNHPEDLEHFAHHEKIEREEEQRERKAEGMPSIEEDEKLRKAAEAKGEKYESPYEAQIPEENAPPPVHEGWNAHSGGHAAHEAAADTQHVFKGPNGAHQVKMGQEQAVNAEQAALEHDLKPDRLEGETDHGYQDRLDAAKQAYEARLATENTKIDTTRRKGESDEEYQRRIAKARFDAAKARPGMAPPSKDAGRKAPPNKYPPIGGSRRKKGSFFGEF